MKKLCRLFKFALPIITLIFVALFFTGCGDDKITNLTLPKDIVHSNAPVTGKVDVDVYFDATVSMRGYTTLAAGNVYRTLPDLLTDIGSSMGEIKFYSFGENIQLLEGRSYRDFSSPNPYNEVITAVHNVIDNANPTHLSIIITDLFESDADWSNISQKIRNKYFANHLAVAVIGIKNSFNGEIFDVGLNAAKFDYNTTDNPARFRPFYLLIMGQESAIIDFIQRFNDRQSLPNETGYLMLSENLSDKSNDFSTVGDLQLKNFFFENNLSLEDKSVREFGLDSFNSDAEIEFTFDYHAVVGACPLNMNEIEYNTNVLSISGNEGDEWKARSNNAKVSLTPIDGNENQFIFKLELTPDKTFDEGKINFVNVTVAPNSKGYQLPNWIRDWNMANVDVDPANFDGSKTINLIHVLGSLKDSVFSSAHPTVINLNFVVDAR